MKRTFFFLFVAAGFVACTSADKKTGESTNADSTMRAEKAKLMSDTANYTSIQWLDSTFLSMGTVNEGAQVEVSFRFKNTGNKPLVIADVTASCGCTIPETPQQPFAPGEEGTIKAKFNSEGRPGENRKHINVDANTSPSRSHELNFTVDVKKID
jgi:hypothetical protein